LRNKMGEERRSGRSAIRKVQEREEKNCTILF
jgi:hypothetical protein